MIFNVVVDALIRNWVTVVVLIEAGSEVLGDKTQELEAFFYADDVLVVYPQVERLQREFNVLTDIFYQVGLHTNMWKMVIMACCQCYNPGRLSKPAYMGRMMGFITLYQEILW